jgi:hypothetical protein
MFPEFTVQQGNVTRVPSDLLLLKYAQAFYGADEYVAEVLVSAGACSPDELRPRPDDFVIVDTKGVISPSRVMFLGTPPLHVFAYDEMRQFAARGVEILASQGLSARRMTTVIHGVGYGLDAVESLDSLMRGFSEALGRTPSLALEEIVFVERNQRRARTLASSLAGFSAPPLQPRSEMQVDVGASHAQAPPSRPAPRDEPADRPPRPGDRPASAKRHVFVAMPYAEEFEDVYEFGIYEPVRRCGFICERVDRAAFTGDILQRIRQRIETADLVIADLTGGRPNVYLEVGYAWGKGTPVVFLARHGEEPHFDVRAHRCIYYKRIGQLARDLEKLIRGLGDSAVWAS